MRKILLVLLLLGCILWQPVLAQERRITGTVRDASSGEALPGVSILIDGTSTGTVTDMNGTYALSAAPNATLVFSFIGYSEQRVPVNNRSVIDVQLREDVEQLSEVVVVGYGTQEKKDATGAVESVKAEDFNKGVISSPEQLIQGKSAGVQITQSSGEPGGGVNIRIRGTSSVRGNNSPLYVVDGVPLSSGDVTPGGGDNGRGASAARNPLNFLNPNDIASIDILKDASATAIYGARGANGVVLITTKSGRGRKHQVEFSTNLSVSRMANRFDLLNAEEYLQAVTDLGNQPINGGQDTDWQDEISRTAFSHRHDLSYGNSHKTGNYRASLSYDDQQGVIRNSGLERYTGRLNVNQNFLKDKLHFAGQLTLSRINDQQAPITDAAGAQSDLLGAAYTINPTLPADPDEQPEGDITNPLSQLKYIQDNTTTDRSLINLSLGYDILPGLNFKVNTGFDNATAERRDVISGMLRSYGNATGNGLANINRLEVNSQLLETLLTYEKKIGNSSVTALLGYSYQQFNRSGLNIRGQGFASTDMSMDAMLDELEESANRIQNAIPSDSSYQQFGYDADQFFVTRLFPDTRISNLDNRPESGVRAVVGNAFDNTDELQSYFGRINYSLLDRYLFTFTLRADGSTRFGGNNKYGYFPSAAFKWRVSDETFVPEFFDDLSVRLGYGVTGNQEIPHNVFTMRERWNDLGITGSNEINPATLAMIAFANPDLKWEQTTQYNLGFDYGLIKNRLTGSLDFYRKVTTDLLIQIESAQPAAQPFIWRNLDADVVNQGVELGLNFIAIDGEKLGLDLGFNFSYNDNVVENYTGELLTGNINGQGLTGSYSQIIRNGLPINAFVVREFNGYDDNGQEINLYTYGDEQRYLGHSPIPTYNLGFNANVRYGNWDLAAYAYGMFGHYIYNNTAHAFFTKGSLASGRNVLRSTVDSEEASDNTAEVSSRFIEKGDFFRMQNLSLGYNFDLENKFIKNLRVNLTGQNLFVITNYSGLDPEVNVNAARGGVPSLGIDYTAYPRARTFTFGLSASF